MQLKPVSNIPWIYYSLARFEQFNIRTGLPHAVLQRFMTVAMGRGEVFGRPPAEQCSWAKIAGATEPGTFLTPQGIKYYIAFQAAAFLCIQQDTETSDDPGSTVEITSFRYAIEMRTSSYTGLRKIFTGKPNTQIAGWIHGSFQSCLAGISFNNFNCCSLTCAIRFARYTNSAQRGSLQFLK